MLSISNVSVEMASTYYEKDNYYTQQRGEYFGSLKGELGLEDLTHDSFQDLIRGKVDGKQLVQDGANGKHRAGYDHTFSAPKSVSVLLELAEAKEDQKLSQAIRKAHDQAVNTSLSHIEQNYITCNNKKDGISNHINTNKMIVAKFEHDTNRELDPTLHTHAVIMNMTKDSDGKYRAISNEILYNNKMLNGQFYRSELAKNLKDLGINIEVTNTKQMLFEIKGIDKSLISEFSQRSKQIAESLDSIREKYPNASETELKQYAALESRKSKKDVDRNQVRADNLERASKIANVDQVLGSIQAETLSLKNIDVQEIIEKASKIITEQESTFTKESLFKIAATLGIGEVRAKDIWDSIEISNLIKISQNQFTTQEILTIEKEIIEFSNTTKDLKSKLIETQIENDSTMTLGQNNALKHILTSKDTLIGIQGDAGTGKTYMLKAVKEFLKDKDMELHGLAFTGKAADELEEGSGIKSTTLHSFLSKSTTPSSKEQIYIVDEASMVGSKQLHQLIARAKEQNARIVLLGDTKQFQTISAGAIFEQLQQRGMQTIVMEETLRQKTQSLKECVQFIKDKQTDNAFEVLEKEKVLHQNINLFGAAYQAYKEDPNALIITSKNNLRNQINEIIRQHRLSQNEIIESQNLVVKEAIALSTQEKFFINAYKKDQIVFFNTSKNGIKAGSEAKIIEVNQDKNEVTLQFGKEDIKVIDISQHGDQLSLFNVKEQSFGIGEKILFTKNDKKLNVKNGNIGTIKSINKQGTITANIQGKTIHFSAKEYNYLDHGYCITDFKAQGATADNVVIIADAEMANIKSFYTQVTRAKYKVKIITDNIQKLKKNVTRNQAKTTTLDHITNNLQVSKQAIKTISQNKLQKLIEQIKEKYQNLKENLHARVKHHTTQRDQQPEHSHDRATETNLGTTRGDIAETESTARRDQSIGADNERDDNRSLSETYQDRSQYSRSTLNQNHEDEMER